MKKSIKHNSILISVLMVLSLMIGATQAGWSEPVCHVELNDFNLSQIGTCPAISADGLRIYFSRTINPSGSFAYSTIIEAWREDTSGPFTAQRILTELTNDMYTGEPWISNDGLRLYYAQIDYSQAVGFQRFIKMAARNEIGQPWTQVKTLTELHKSFSQSVDTKPTLTGNELIIMWMSNRVGGLSSRKIYTATRPTIWHSFTNIREVSELNAIGASGTSLSTNGLSVYFDVPFNGLNKLYKGTRNTLDEPFGNFEALDEINNCGVHTYAACISPNEKTIYFNQRQGEDLTSLTTRGIFVSYWVDEPYVQAVEGLSRAIEEKGRLVERLNKTIKGEMATAKLLSDALRKGGFEGVKRPAIVQAYMGVIKAIQKEILARFNLNRSISDLQESLEKIQPPQPAEQQAGAGRTIKPQSQRDER